MARLFTFCNDVFPYDIYCGPHTIASIVNRPVSNVFEAIRKNEGMDRYEPITGMYDTAILRAFRHFQWYATEEVSFSSTKMKLSDFHKKGLSRGGPYVMRCKGHVFAVCGGFISENNHHNAPDSIRSYLNGGGRDYTLIGWWKMERR